MFTVTITSFCRQIAYQNDMEEKVAALKMKKLEKRQSCSVSG
jgi:hypothetical protein